MPIPRATARLQLHKEFNFDQAAEVVPYYARLGVSHIYASPILTARTGSTHGYDVVDPTRINPELGGEEGLRRFVSRIRAEKLGLILDIVPNHMGIGPENPWWQHVLEWGSASPYAHWFDIDWEPADESLRGKILAPFLGQPYGDILAAGEIKLQYDPQRGKFFASYYSHRFPIAPADYGTILRAVESETLIPIIATFEERDAQGWLRQQDADVGFSLLRAHGETNAGRAEIDAVLAAHDAATPTGFEALHALLERQHYRLAWWRVAADGMNWRRFFEVTDLAGVRVEQDDVFEATHAQIFRLYAEGLIDGVRIDHVDGLADPGAYCRKLRQRLQALSSQRPPELPPGPGYVIVEKILAPHEQLRANWEIDGTSGYDFMDRVGAVLHDPAGEAPLTAMWTSLTGSEHDFDAEVRQARRQLLANNLAGEFEAAARALHRLARTDLRTRDFSLGAIRRVFTELLVFFPVYRTYADVNGRDEIDDAVIDAALECARQSVERTEVPLLDVLARWLGGAAPRDAADPRVRRLHQRAITRFQQLTPPLAAKSVEDTAFYRYGRLLSRNEVGSDPGEFCILAEEFHAGNRIRAERFPNSMLATATHDHKRGEDVRARISVLSECASEWERTVRRWMEMNSVLRTELEPSVGEPGASDNVAPHPADELMLYQMLFGAWPIGLDPQDRAGVQAFAERIERWQTKALREAKQVSDWVLPNEAYEAACKRFLYAALEARPDNPFLPDLADTVRRLTPAGVVKSLAQTVLRLTSPGVPDLYQGTDLWDFSLVDPDNRRPVDYAARTRLLDAAGEAVQSIDGWEDGRIKQLIVRNLLQLRSRLPALFSRGAYLPLQVSGTRAGEVLAFARHGDGQLAVVVVPLRAHALLGTATTPAVDPEAWGDTSITLPADMPAPPLRDVLTGASVPAGGSLALREVLARLPVAVLAGE